MPKSPPLLSAIYHGEVFHRRFVPKNHAFSYTIFLMWLNLDEIDQLESIRGFSSRSWAPIRFKRGDYYGDASRPLQSCILEKMSELALAPLQGKVFLLSQMRTLGLYFSPVNFYYLQQKDGHYSHVLAEVSNTPWNQRHYYLVDLNQQQDCEKQFHVSPFNPMDMQYKWAIKQPSDTLQLSLACHQKTKHFVASISMNKLEMNSKNLLHVLIRIPSMTVKTVVGIYWQAFKLFIKGVPIYAHPDQGKK